VGKCDQPVVVLMVDLVSQMQMKRHIYTLTKMLVCFLGYNTFSENNLIFTLTQLVTVYSAQQLLPQRDITGTHVVHEQPHTIVE